ncbi:MAG TPA: hypothetical protein VFY01_12000 [Rheinheimera sp.]|nr:hypothetical protein [Rheinheimera sp.]
MRWLSSFALMLYLSLLCTPQAFAVHDARLSPLADTQFHAVTPQQIPQCTAGADQENTDEPQPVLPAPGSNTLLHSLSNSQGKATPACNTLFLTLQQARAPPAPSSQLM